ncbi:ARM repeat-containing protein [Ramaria rubella]|nr:ARM repeat-containing protein [Ramaria rubella]
MKGLLNRLSEQNIASIISSIEEMYRNHKRHDITSTLTKLIIDGISSHSSHLDSFVVLHASLIASLYKIIGVDLAAHFIQFLISSYEQNYEILRGSDLSESTGDDPKGKECLNLAVLLSELYNFQVVSCVLVYDIIRGLLETLDEFDVELLLKIVRNSGQQLRQDDPSALKDIVDIVHKKMSGKVQSTISSRTQFMIETLTNLKNNKIKRVAGQDGHSESTERLKKFLSGLSKKYHVMAHEPLRVNLNDLHSSEKKGKWWLVGSAWGGDPLLDRTYAEDQPTSKDQPLSAADSLLKLARKQGMNTDVRRSIFVVLMSSDDYVDACERLSQLNLSEVQQREIVRVVLHCLGNEKQYNPYYTLVVQQLCRTSHSYKVTLQFCLWDFLRDLGEKGVGGAEIIKGLQDEDVHAPFDEKKISPTRRLNIARAYAWWMAKGCASLTILKPVDFTLLQSQSREFFRNLFLQLFVSSQVASPAITPNAEAAAHLTGAHFRESLEEVFIKATRIPTLTQGLIYFFTNTLRGDDGSNNETVSETLKWAREVAKDTLRAGMDVVASLT